MDSDTGGLLGVVLLLVLLALDFVVDAFASALQTATDSELQLAYPETEKPPDDLLRLREPFGQLTHTVWLLHTAAFAGAGFFGAWLVFRHVSWAALPVLAVLLYFLGLAIPRLCGCKNTLRWLQRYGRIRWILTLLSPLAAVFSALTGLVIRLLRIDAKSLDQSVTGEEIISMVNEVHEQGVIDAGEAEMIQNIFELSGKNAGDIMTHRKNIVGISSTVNLRDAIAFMVGEPVSRFPVYEENIDSITGVLHFKDAMKFHTIGDYDDWLIRDIPELIRTVRFIPETRGINTLFRSMQAAKLQMVIVVDEYGQTAGLVTMEDILEEIVGNIQDEYDKDVQMIRREPNGSYLMDGMAPLEEAVEVLDIELDGEDYDTLNGLLISKLDRIPADGEQAEVTAYGYLFQVLKVENKMIRLVRITKIKEEEKE